MKIIFKESTSKLISPSYKGVGPSQVSMTSFKAGQKWATSRQLWDLLASAARQLSSKEVRAHF